MMDARSKGRLTDAQIEKYHSEAEKDLAQAEALRKKGIKTSYDDLLKTIDALKSIAAKGDKPSKDLMEQAEKELAAYYGGTPEESKSWLGELKLRGFNFKGATDEGKVSGALDQTVPSQSLGTRIGKGIPAAWTGFLTGVGEAGKGAVTNLQDFMNAIGGNEPTPQTTGPYKDKAFVP
jgi:hypothetical protein